MSRRRKRPDATGHSYQVIVAASRASSVVSRSVRPLVSVLVPFTIHTLVVLGPTPTIPSVAVVKTVRGEQAGHRNPRSATGIFESHGLCRVGKVPTTIFLLPKYV